MTEETQIKSQIKDYLRIKNIFFWYNLQGIGAYKGIPDLIAVHKGKTYGIEVKTPKGKLSTWQQAFRLNLEENGGVYVEARCLEDIIKLR